MKKCFAVVAAAVLAALLAGAPASALVTYDDFTSSTVSSGLWTFSGSGYTIGSGLDISVPTATDTEFKLTATHTIPAGTDFTVVVPFTITGTTLNSGSGARLEIALRDVTDHSNKVMVAWGALQEYMGMTGTGFATGSDSPATFDTTTLMSAALGLIYNGTTIQAGYYKGGVWNLLYTYDVSGWGSTALEFQLSAGVDGAAALTAVVPNVSYYAAVPIPGALFLLAPGLAGLAVLRRRFRK